MISPLTSYFNKFQSTLPRRERRDSWDNYANRYVFQSTLPRRERRKAYAYAKWCVEISIHAPAKGATKHGDPTQPSEIDISIHAPAKGATIMQASVHKKTSISIHAPAKGATLTQFFQSDLTRISIHAPAKGATRHTHASLLLANDFNPRSREGSDASVIKLEGKSHNFNPRSREGSDLTLS